MSFAERRPRGLRRRRAEAARGTAGTGVAERAAVERAAARSYVGLVTRALAFALDAAVIDAAALVAAAVVTLALSVVSVPSDVRTALAVAGGVLYVLWTIAYFVTFWTTTGQTPGNRVLGIRVETASGERLPPRRSLLRFVALTLAALPLGAGFLLILVDDRRRGLHDRIARTVVVEAGPGEAPEAAALTRRPPPA